MDAGDNGDLIFPGSNIDHVSPLSPDREIYCTPTFVLQNSNNFPSFNSIIPGSWVVMLFGFSISFPLTQDSPPSSE